MAFYWPGSAGEWLAWGSAVITTLFGLTLFLMPRTMLRGLHLETRAKHPEAVAEARSTIAGFYMGVGISALLTDQVFLWFAVGVCWAIAALGRILSILSDSGNTLQNWIFFIIQIALAAAPLLFFFNYIP